MPDMAAASGMPITQSSIRLVGTPTLSPLFFLDDIFDETLLEFGFLRQQL
jgi:hypothetical protein